MITFADAASATAALVLDNASVNGKPVSVRLMRSQAPRSAAPAPAKAAPAAPKAARAPREPQPARAAAQPGAVLPDTVAVLGLRDVPPEEIAEHFASCGEIDSIRFVFRGYVHPVCCCVYIMSSRCLFACATRSG